MKAFTVKHNANRYDVKPLNGHFQRYKVKVNGMDVFFEHDLDGHLRAEPTKGADTALLLALAERIEEGSRN